MTQPATEALLQLLGRFTLPKHEAVRQHLQAAIDALAELDSSDGSLAMRRDGEFWTIVWRDRALHVHDAKGLRYLATLTHRPNTEIPAWELVGGVDLGDCGEVIDERARSAYRQRVVELQLALDDADDAGDWVAAGRARAELDQLMAALSEAVGIGGRMRRAGSAAERARVAATKAIKKALDRIEQHDVELGRHLRRSVRTGTYCSYLVSATH